LAAARNWSSPGIGGGKGCGGSEEVELRGCGGSEEFEAARVWRRQEIVGILDLGAAGTGHSDDSLGDANDEAQSSVNLGVVSPPYSF